MAVFPVVRTTHRNTECGQNIVSLNVKHAGTYRNQWALMVNVFRGRNM